MGKHLQGVQEEEDNEKRGRTLERRKERERESAVCCEVLCEKEDLRCRQKGREESWRDSERGREGGSECDREAQWKRERDCEGGEETVSHSASLSTSSEGLLAFPRLISALPHGLD